MIHILLLGFGVFTDPAGIDEEFRKAWFSFFCRSGQRERSLEEFNFEVRGWLPTQDEVFFLFLLVKFRRKGATAGILDGWVAGAEGLFLVPWFDGLARTLTKVEEIGV